MIQIAAIVPVQKESIGKDKLAVVTAQATDASPISI